MNANERKNMRKVSRREFLKTSAFVGGSAFLAARLPWMLGVSGHAEAGTLFSNPAYIYELAKPENVLYSTCLQCHVACQIKAKTWNGVLAKLDGSPYSPQNYLPHLSYDTPLEDAVSIDGKLCPKGQAGIQTYYDPYRLRKVLKRQGRRGSGKWKSIPFSQFIQEVVEGGKLFAEIGDERYYPGFDEVIALRDAALARRMAEDAKKVGKGTLDLDTFKEKYREHLDVLIDPDHPDLGPKNNQFVFMAGRIEHGRKELMKRFTHQSLGSRNTVEHTSICEVSHHVAYEHLTGGDNGHMKPDLANAQFVVFWGTGAFSANFGLTPMAEKVTRGRSERGLKTAVIDPRLSNDAAKSDWWLPVKPGTDGALALAMIRWILENGRYDDRYLRNANRAAAIVDGEPTWTNACYLVKILDGHPRELLRASEAGIGGAGQYVIQQGRTLIAVDPENASEPLEGDLFATAEVNGITVKSVLQLLWEEAASRSLEEYEEITGIPAAKFIAVAAELTSHGKRAAVELYRGPVKHTDGFYAAAAIITLNLLIGNPDWQGGLAKGGGHWHEFGGKPGSVYDFEQLHPGALTPFGPKITREGERYEDFSLFREEGYPAKRPWFPFTENMYHEVIPSFADGYPYAGKILFLHKGTPLMSIPAGDRMVEILSDPERVPLFIACDIVIGETSMYADYIVPDLVYLERWGTPHITPDVPTKVSKVRQPVAFPLTEEVNVDGATMPISMEAFLIALAKRLGVSGFGKNAFGPGMHFDYPEDWYLKAVANIAFGDDPGETVPDATAGELELFRMSRRHLPGSVFDETRWRKALRPHEWSKVVYVLNRGGRFAPFETAYQGPYMKRRMGKMFHLFFEEVARQRNSLNGEYFPGLPHYREQYDSIGHPLKRNSKYTFQLITYKEPFGGHSRTISNYWGNIALQPENKVLINVRDAAKLGLRTDDLVRLVSIHNPEGKVNLGDGRMTDMLARLEVREGIRPGVVAASWHYGHWAYGSNDVVVDGQVISGDERRSRGIVPNPIMAVDPVLQDVCLTDPVGGSASFFDTYVALEKV